MHRSTCRIRHESLTLPIVFGVETNRGRPVKRAWKLRDARHSPAQREVIPYVQVSLQLSVDTVEWRVSFDLLQLLHGGKPKTIRAMKRM
jgi:hypothetical protein